MAARSKARPAAKKATPPKRVPSAEQAATAVVNETLRQARHDAEQIQARAAEAASRIEADAAEQQRALLAAAQEEADEIRARAEADAETELSAARSEAKALRAVAQDAASEEQAKAEAAIRELEDAARNRAEQIRVAANTEAEQTIQTARDRSSRIVDQALADAHATVTDAAVRAEGLRGEADQYAATARTEADEVRADAGRVLDEAKRIKASAASEAEDTQQKVGRLREQRRQVQKEAGRWSLGVIAISALITIFGSGNAHDVLAKHHTPDPWGWCLYPALEAALIVEIQVGSALSGHARAVVFWGTALRVVTAAAAVTLCVYGPAENGDPGGAVLHALGPLVQFFLAEFLAASRRQFLGASKDIDARIEALLHPSPAASEEVPVSAPDPATEKAAAANKETPPAAPRKKPDPATGDAPKKPAPAPRKDATWAPRQPVRKRPGGSARDAAKTAIRALYDAKKRRPLESEMIKALKRINSPHDSRQFAQKIRSEIERDEPHLATLGSDNVRAISGN